MKALVYDARETISVAEHDVPSPSRGEVLVKVKWAGICGSDLVAWNGGFKRIVKPVILGHEFTGEIVEIGGDSELSLKAGQHVVVEPLIACGQCEACRTGHYNVCRKLRLIGLDVDGGFASYVSVPSYRIHPIPDTLSYERAALCEPIAVAIHMVRRTNLLVGDTVTILGAGPIGVLVAMIARKAGASKIVISDVNRYRLNLVKELGFQALDGNLSKKEDFLSYLGEEGSDVTFELAAQESTLWLSTEVTKIRGTILAGGIFKNPPPIALQELTLKEQQMIGSRVYTFSDFEAAINLLMDKEFNPEVLISRRVSINEAIPQGFEAIKKGEDVMKVLISLD